ncbi:Uri superfamily endonuclease [Halanaerobium saccharolyticum]|uniref:Uri superfamily endonuclease n=1 Tax=Halanaerobium saccharolyticum TaxID=43595 RepID=A0A4V6PTJ4_9FIRM|nr:GIY-YIG nuclease family protein [Halanaerobium saccharolyticum]TDO83303.1 Uri superfamily endonuclease [Halanaerobium saccharolyticum]
MQVYPDGGVYILKIKLEVEKKIEVGALGRKTFAPGYYFYTGTAQSNLKARVKRHYSSDKKFHWHIDYLLAEADLENDFVFELPGEGECFLARVLIENGGRTPAAGFGASDCSCDSHLIYFSLTTGSTILENLVKNNNLEAEFNDFKK